MTTQHNSHIAWSSWNKYESKKCALKCSDGDSKKIKDTLLNSENNAGISVALLDLTKTKMNKLFFLLWESSHFGKNIITNNKNPTTKLKVLKTLNEIPLNFLGMS